MPKNARQRAKGLAPVLPVGFLQQIFSLYWLSMPCSTLFLYGGGHLGRSRALIPHVGASRIKNNEEKILMLPTLTPNYLRLGHRSSSSLGYLTLQMYNYEAVCTRVPRHLHIPGNALLFFRRNSGQRVDFSGHCLIIINISKLPYNIANLHCLRSIPL